MRNVDVIFFCLPWSLKTRYPTVIAAAVSATGSVPGLAHVTLHNGTRQRFRTPPLASNPLNLFQRKPFFLRAIRVTHL